MAKKKHSALESARQTLTLETRGLEQLQQSLGESFEQAVDLLHKVGGRVIVSGMGKSGHISAKIAATFASTGTPAYFVHPAEASHGDLGMIRKDDALVMFSRSGETAELHNLVTYAKRFSIPLLAVTSEASSALARAGDVVLELPKSEEACPNGLAPTTSTTMQLALGDALAVALMERRGFSPAQMREFHPGGALGSRLMRVRDVMHTGEHLPLVAPDTLMSEALVVMSRKGFGCLGITEDDKLVGVITDGDLRRHMEDGLLQRRTREVMTLDPVTVEPDILVAEAIALVNRVRITCLFVVEEGRACGIVHAHDLLRE
ncbi:MAG: KpsF/GutQ family sugar-phosphate isomerase [Hyphomicrobiales bacterium]|nr:KpsF/GutQ family sugar-phosphate isomerase [Hyphomicrobiales bacterium]MCY4033546.1 KpsF/GutQ family sugar-phosphate isomerase [Hyphomicrobiales bacterium]MCY4039081.1 KpsF/GutQ family sugar-phosphate isomerase [Hyphomicrobiales bacterium]